MKILLTSWHWYYANIVNIYANKIHLLSQFKCYIVNSQENPCFLNIYSRAHFYGIVNTYYIANNVIYSEF